MMLLHCPFPVESRTPRVWSWTSRLAVVVASIAAACLVIRWPQASLAVPAPTAASPAPRRFQVAYFVARPLLDEISGVERSVVSSLPLALPPRFDLDVEVRSSEADLSQIHIAGQSLGISGGATTPGRPIPDRESPTAIHREGATDWHRVHIRSDHHLVTVVVDGQIVSSAPRKRPASDWLTVESPSHAPAEFRDLTVSW
jgi:hypothetical protein